MAPLGQKGAETKEVLSEMNEKGQRLWYVCQVEQADKLSLASTVEGSFLESNHHHYYVIEACKPPTKGLGQLS